MKLYDSNEISVKEILNRDITAEANVEAAVDAIIADVRNRGDAALFDYTERFDRVRLDALEVTEDELNEAVASVDPYFMETLRQAERNIRAYHSRQKRTNYIVNDDDGIVMGQRVIPLKRVGLYIPGGTASYPSSVLMNVVPASIAGVDEIVMVTPPGRDGKLNPAVLAAASVAGVHRIFKVGGAQAVAALAYGTESIERADKIVGPGNIFVATAKRRVYGIVDIDMIAGPSEILVVADNTANAEHVAADMLSQAEHDALSTAVLVTPSRELALSVMAEIERQLALLPRAEIAGKSIEDNCKLIVVPDLKRAVEISNAIAPEHLELCVDDPFALLNSVRNAGSVFLGKYAPEALGDYFAGPNHTLPTSGTARFASPLGVDDFVKRSSFIYYTKEALSKVGDRIVDFAEREGLTAHARSVSVRFQDR